MKNFLLVSALVFGLAIPHSALAGDDAVAAIIGGVVGYHIGKHHGRERDREPRYYPERYSYRSAESSTNQGYRLKWVKSEPNFTAGQLRSFATAGRYGQTDRVEFPNVST